MHEAERIRVEPFDAADATDWDDYVAGAKDSTFCHLTGWREVMADVLHHEPLYSVARNGDGEWQGVLPLVRVKSRLFGHYLVSMPFLNYGGPLGGATAQRDLAMRSAEYARTTTADLLELRSRHPVSSDLSTSDRKITVVSDLAASAETHWRENVPSSRRRQIRRAQKEDMETRFGHDQLEPFYHVFARNMRALGTPVLPRAFFERIARVFGERVIFGTVYWRETPAAAGCGFLWRDEFELTWVSSLRELNRKYPNMLLYWSFMEHLIERGVSVFNFGRCTPGGRTHSFKRQWGGVDVPLPWRQWSARGVTATPTPERPLYRIATRLWQKVPLTVTNRIGPLLARNIP